MKINLSDKAIAQLLKDAELEQTCGCTSEGRPDYNLLEKVVDELGVAKRDENGRIAISREVLDWVVAEFDYAYTSER